MIGYDHYLVQALECCKLNFVPIACGTYIPSILKPLWSNRMSSKARSFAPDRLPRVGTSRAGVVVAGSLTLIAVGLAIIVVDSGSAELSSPSFGFLSLIAGSFGVFVGALLALYSYYQTKRLARLLAGDKFLAHWTISGEGWKRYIANERARANRELLIFTLVLVAIAFAAELLSRSSGQSGAGSETGTWSDAFAVLACLIGINLLDWGVRRLRLFTLSRRTHTAIYITTDGVVLDRQWHTWRGFGCWLESVTYESGADKELVFTYRQRSARPTTSEVKLYVPIPDSHVQEAKRLVARFKQH